jgi:biotin transporter BioY
MYIIAIAWIYVVTLMAATEKTVAAGLLTFVFYGLLPCALLLWILGVNHRRFKKHQKSLLEEEVSDQDSTDTNRDE